MEVSGKGGIGRVGGGLVFRSQLWMGDEGLEREPASVADGRTIGEGGIREDGPLQDDEFFGGKFGAVDVIGYLVDIFDEGAGIRGNVGEGRGGGGLDEPGIDGRSGNPQAQSEGVVEIGCLGIDFVGAEEAIEECEVFEGAGPGFGTD